MKSRKTLTHQLLIAEVIKQLKFPAKVRSCSFLKLMIVLFVSFDCFFLVRFRCFFFAFFSSNSLNSQQAFFLFLSLILFCYFLSCSFSKLFFVCVSPGYSLVRFRCVFSLFFL